MKKKEVKKKLVPTENGAQKPISEQRHPKKAKPEKKKLSLFGKKTAKRPMQKPVQKPMQKPAQRPMQKPIQEPVQKPAGVQPVVQDKALQKEIIGEQRRAYNKAVKNRSAKSNKKRGSRGGNYVLYYVFAAIVAIVVFIILANTVLFNCSAIEVKGIQKYTAEEIIEASKLKTGDSLLSIDASAAERRIVEAFSFVDKCKVEKSYPTKIIITVTEAERWFAVEHDGATYTISRLGKIIEKAPAGSLPIIVGFEASEPQVGGTLSSEIEGKNDLPTELLSAAEAAGLTDITSIDITDRFEITVLVQNRITLQLGIATELENKMYIAKELIDNEITATESVTVNLTNTEKVYVRDNNVIDNPVQVAPVLPEADTSEATSEGTAEA